MKGILGIAGLSGSGKSTLARALAQRLVGAGHTAAVLSADRYYHDVSHLAGEALACHNFDHPDAIEHAQLLEDLDELEAGRAVIPPRYDFAEHRRLPGAAAIDPPDWLIVEGLFVLLWPELGPRLSHKVFVDADLRTCLERRLARDQESRGRSRKSIIRQFEESVVPMGERHVLPSRAEADLVVSGQDGLDTSLRAVLALLTTFPQGTVR